MGRTTRKLATEVAEYDVRTKILHWVFAGGILYASAVGYALHFIPPGRIHTGLSHLNMSLASVLILLFPFRVWWRIVRPEPAPPQGLSAGQVHAARMIQTVIYAAIFAVLASGYLMVPDGYWFFGFAWVPTPFAKGAVTDFFFMVHRIGCAALVSLVGLHLGGVILHTFVKPIGLLRRMA